MEDQERVIMCKKVACPLFLPLFFFFRELKGFPNPTEFFHPLMNTPLVRMFLELKTPLAKPAELPYAKELLAKLKEACPQIEVEI